MIRVIFVVVGAVCLCLPTTALEFHFRSTVEKKIWNSISNMFRDSFQLEGWSVLFVEILNFFH